MKNFSHLAACILFVLCTASTCDPCLETCDDFYIILDTYDSSLIVDSVVYTTEDVKVFTNYQNAAYPSIVFYVPINPSIDKSEIMIFTNKGDSKVQFKHKYDEYYDDDCRDYVFRLDHAEATSSTVKVSNGYTDEACMTFRLEL